MRALVGPQNEYVSRDAEIDLRNPLLRAMIRLTKRHGEAPRSRLGVRNHVGSYVQHVYLLERPGRKQREPARHQLTCIQMMPTDLALVVSGSEFKAEREGFEPPIPDSESGVLPLDDLSKQKTRALGPASKDGIGAQGG